MNIMVIGSNALDVDLFCGATLEKFAREGHRVSVIIVQNENEFKSVGSDQGTTSIRNSQKDNISYSNNFLFDLTEDEAKALFARFGIYQLHFISGFDYSAITQRNGELLSAYRKQIKPTLVIIPFWKSKDDRNRILSRSALIACRGVGNILMYNDGKDNNLYFQNLIFQIMPNSHTRTPFDYVPKPEDIDVAVRQHQEINDVNDFRRTLQLVPDSFGGQEFAESFESHRLLLLEDEENDWL